MNTVTVLTHSVDRAQIIRLFAKFTSRYLQVWTSIVSSNEAWEFIIDDWLEELSKFSLSDLHKAVREAFDTYKKFPPKLGEIVDLCLKASGVPNESQVAGLMIKKEFSHPIVKMLRDKIGSWMLTTGTEKEVSKKLSELYPQAISDFQQDPKIHWQRLQDFKDMELKSLPTPEKIPTKGESAAFRECMNKCQEILQGKGIKGKTHKEFDENLITPCHRDFDTKVYDEFREYLLSIPETETMILPPTYAYRRMKFIAMKEQTESFRKCGGSPNPQGQDRTQRSGQNEPVRMYKNYTKD